MAQITLSAAVRKFGSKYHVALLCDVSQSTVSRWKAIPEHHIKTLEETPAKRLKRGGKR